MVPSAEALRGPLERAFAALGVPVAVDARMPLGRTAVRPRAARAVPLRLARRRPRRAVRVAPLAGLGPRPLAGRRLGGADPRPRPPRRARRVRAPGGALRADHRRRRDAARRRRAARGAARLLERAAPAAFGLDARVRGEGAGALQVRAWRAADRALASLASLSEPPSPAELVRALEGVSVRVGDDRRSGRVRVVGLRRARTHRADAVIVVGLEEGRLPGRGRPEAFLSDDVRRALTARGLRLERRDAAARDRYLFATAVTRARRQLVLVRRATGDDGTPREPSPFWDEARRALGDGAPPPLRRGLAELTHPLDTAPSERERLRALAALASDDSLLAARLATANGEAWARKIDRARKALVRRTRLADRALIDELAARVRFPVSELESFVDCSQKWFVMRVLDPRDIDGVVDAKTRGKVAHSALQRFFNRLPATIGKDVLEADDLARAEPLLRDVIAESLSRERLPQDSLEMLELGRALERDLTMFLRSELALEHRLVPRRLEVSFGTGGAPPSLGGLVLGDFSVSGRIDRIDVDPHSARGLVQDYKYSARADGATDIGRERRLQLPLYILALRELLGLEPVGGVYRALGAGGLARGLLRAEARDDGAEGFRKNDYLEEDAFWASSRRRPRTPAARSAASAAATSGTTPARALSDVVRRVPDLPGRRA